MRDTAPCGTRSGTVTGARTEKVVEFSFEREAAEEMIREVREDEPMLAEELRVGSRAQLGLRCF